MESESKTEQEIKSLQEDIKFLKKIITAQSKYMVALEKRISTLEGVALVHLLPEEEN